MKRDLARYESRILSNQELDQVRLLLEKRKMKLGDILRTLDHAGLSHPITSEHLAAVLNTNGEMPTAAPIVTSSHIPSISAPVSEGNTASRVHDFSPLSSSSSSSSSTKRKREETQTTRKDVVRTKLYSYTYLSLFLTESLSVIQKLTPKALEAVQKWINCQPEICLAHAACNLEVERELLGTYISNNLNEENVKAALRRFYVFHQVFEPETRTFTDTCICIRCKSCALLTCSRSDLCSERNH